MKNKGLWEKGGSTSRICAKPFFGEMHLQKLSRDVFALLVYWMGATGSGAPTGGFLILRLAMY
jgi:hypothetical protein